MLLRGINNGGFGEFAVGKNVCCNNGGRNNVFIFFFFLILAEVGGNLIDLPLWLEFICGLILFLLLEIIMEWAFLFGLHSNPNGNLLEDTKSINEVHGPRPWILLHKASNRLSNLISEIIRKFEIFFFFLA